MSAKTPAGAAARADMGKESGTDQAGFESQLKTTHIYYKPKVASAFTNSSDAKRIMKLVRDFLFAHQLLGQDAKSADVVGIAFPDGTVLGSKANVKFRFSTTFMEEAAQGKL